MYFGIDRYIHTCHHVPTGSVLSTVVSCCRTAQIGYYYISLRGIYSTVQYGAAKPRVGLGVVVFLLLCIMQATKRNERHVTKPKPPIIRKQSKYLLLPHPLTTTYIGPLESLVIIIIIQHVETDTSVVFSWPILPFYITLQKCAPGFCTTLHAFVYMYSRWYLGVGWYSSSLIAHTYVGFYGSLDSFLYLY